MLVDSGATGEKHSQSGGSDPSRWEFAVGAGRAGTSIAANGQSKGSDTAPQSCTFHRRRWKWPLPTFPRVRGRRTEGSCKAGAFGLQGVRQAATALESVILDLYSRSSAFGAFRWAT